MKNYSVKMNTRFQCTRHGFTAFLPVTLMLTVLSCANLDTYIKKGDYPRAQRYCENQKGAEGRRCFTALGEHLLDTHRYSPAVVAFQKAGRQEMVKTTYYRWAKSLRSKGDLQGALVFFQKAEDSTEIEKTHGLLGEKYRKEGKRVLAADHFRRAKDSKRSRRAMFMALKELCNKGDFSGARQFLVGWGVNNRRALIQVAFLALDMGQSKGVIAWLSGEKWKPKRITSLLARHAFMRGRLQEAEKLYPASDAQPLLWGMLLAQKWVQRGNAKRAFLALRRAKKSETDAAASVAGLLLDAKKYLPAGRYFLKAGKLKTARFCFERCLLSSKPYEVSRGLLGLVYAGDTAVVAMLPRYKQHSSAVVSRVAAFLMKWKGKQPFRTIFVDRGIQGKITKSHLRIAEGLAKNSFQPVKKAMKVLGRNLGRMKSISIKSDVFYGVKPASHTLRPGIENEGGGLGGYDVVVVCYRDFDEVRRRTGHLLIGYPAIPIAMKVHCSVQLPPIGVVKNYTFEVIHPLLLSPEHSALRRKDLVNSRKEFVGKTKLMATAIARFLSSYAQ